MYIPFDQSFVSSIIFHDHIFSLASGTSIQHNHLIVSSIIMQNHIIHLVCSEVFLSWSVECFVDNQPCLYFSVRFIERHSLRSVFCSLETHPRLNYSSGFSTIFHHEQSFVSRQASMTDFFLFVSWINILHGQSLDSSKINYDHIIHLIIGVYIKHDQSFFSLIFFQDNIIQFFPDMHSSKSVVFSIGGYTWIYHSVCFLFSWIVIAHDQSFVWSRVITDQIFLSFCLWDKHSSWSIVYFNDIQLGS